jgi:phosphoribosylformylglycinamidine cyclo-ligase
VAALEMFRAFNMGVGMVVITSADNVSHIMSRAAACGIAAWELGTVVPGTGRVRLDGQVT